MGFSATKEEIQYHYDVGDGFYELWLDSSLTYSCAYWNSLSRDSTETLESAQVSKYRYHLENACANKANALLDIGCGWGGGMSVLTDEYDVPNLTGLTLSEKQNSYIKRKFPNADVRLESWEEFDSERVFESIVSIGAFEHFCGRQMLSEEKITHYRRFFEKCNHWLRNGGYFSLQTIGYNGVGASERQKMDQMSEKIFPGSSLPTLKEIVYSCDGLFRIESCVDHRYHYEKTLREWYKRFFYCREEIVEKYGNDTFNHFRMYLRMSQAGFQSDNLSLFRIKLTRI